MNEIEVAINRLGSPTLTEEFLSLERCESEMDFSKLCRTCLRETSDNDLANDTLCIINSNGKLVRVYEMFEIATGLKIESIDTLPHHLCSACLKLVNSSYNFRTQSQRADEILRGVLANVKNKSNNPIEENQPNADLPEEDEEQETVESSKDADEIEEVSLVVESDDDFPDILEDEVMEIEQLEEVSEPDEKYEELNMEVPGNYFTCPFCTKVFFLQRDIIQHYRKEHPKEKPFKCEKCLASFAHIQSMRRHSKIHVASSKEKMCPLCSRLFHRADDLKRHIRTHTDERPYPCSVCQKAFKQHTELKDHMLTHAESKMYKCTLCTKEWRSRNGWYLHMKAHQGKRDVYRRRPKKKITVQTAELTDEVDTVTIKTTC